MVRGSRQGSMVRRGLLRAQPRSPADACRRRRHDAVRARVGDHRPRLSPGRLPHGRLAPLGRRICPGPPGRPPGIDGGTDVAHQGSTRHRRLADDCPETATTAAGDGQGLDSLRGGLGGAGRELFALHRPDLCRRHAGVGIRAFRSGWFARLGHAGAAHRAEKAHSLAEFSSSFSSAAHGACVVRRREPGRGGGCRRKPLAERRFRARARWGIRSCGGMGRGVHRFLRDGCGQAQLPPRTLRRQRVPPGIRSGWTPL